MSQIPISIDYGLYDRQIRTYGEDAVMKITTSSVLIYGLEKGLGTEIAKNLTLSGIRNVYLFDDSKVELSDLETGFYYNSSCVGCVRSQCIISKLQELNPYVNVQAVDNINYGQNVTIVINKSVEQVSVISNYCRKNNSKLVVLYSGGVSGVVFVDVGLSHTITDVSGEIIDPVQIGDILSNGKVSCATHATHDFQSGDIIRFENLEGSNLTQFIEKEWKIKVINNTTFQLENFINITPFNFINGTAVHVKKIINISNQTWDEQLKNPTVNFSFDPDFSIKLIQTYIQMYGQNIINSMPFIWSDTNDIFMKSNNIILPEYARIFNFELINVVSLMGSVAASEAIKLVTNKYTPVNQWFTWWDSELLPKTKPNYIDAKTSYGILWGTEFETKLFNSKWFVVGSGAIGCEHLKNLAFMNVGNSEYGSGQITLTDPDTIERSNLNRQFLFRPHHVGKPKSYIAAQSICNLKPNINIKSMLQKVGNDNVSFTDSIMENDLTGVLNALDNIAARRFMDEQCFKFQLPLFESGTTGTKGNTQPVIPYVTETYSNSTDPDLQKSFPLCTIKSFPNEITHTIHWAMDQFEFFNRAPLTLNRWVNDPSFIDFLGSVENSTALHDINEFTVKHPTQKLGLKCCVEWAVDMFNENYYYSIIQLLDSFPHDHEITEGVKFWSAGKRCPQPIRFDINNKCHFEYIKASTHLFARVSGISDIFSDDELCQFILSYKPIEIKPKKIFIPANDNEIKNDKITLETPDFATSIPIGSPIEFSQTFVPQDFEKDDDTNWHINWITAASNMRALNYGIPIANSQQTKGIAGKIIPAIATTTSAISGLILLEMLKYLLGYDKVDKYRSTFINLAEPVLVYSDPISSPQIKINGNEFNSWTKFEYNKDTTLGEFKEYFDKLFGVSISIIVIGTCMIYADFCGTKPLSEYLSNLIKQTLDSVPSLVLITLATEDDTILPNITVKLSV